MSSFSFDVFLSHSSKDKAVVRAVAERLRADGLRVWFDNWEIRPGDSIPSKIEEGLEHSRVLVLCMSGQAFGSDWAQLEAGTFRFRDPLNKERRFIPLRLDEAPIKGSLAQFLYIKWLPADREQEYAKLLEACRSPAQPPAADEVGARGQVAERAFQLDYEAAILTYAFSPDGKRALASGGDKTVRLWDVETGHCLRTFEGHTRTVGTVAWRSDQRRAVSGASDNTARLWDVGTGRCLLVLQGHTDCVYGLAWGADQRRVLSGSKDKTVRMWDIDTGRCLRMLDDHTGPVLRVAWSANQRRALSSSDDTTVRLWDVETGRCLRVLEGHTGAVLGVAWSADDRRALSGSTDHTVRLWDVESGRCLCVLGGHAGAVRSVAWSADQRRAFSGGEKGDIRVWDLAEFDAEARESEAPATASRLTPDQIQYTNAKVLLVGEGDAGKTGLSKRLASDTWEHSDKTFGAWSTQWKLPVASKDGVEREIWLWNSAAKRING